MWLPNGAAAVRAWWAINYLGATLVPINLAYRGSLLEHVLANSGISLLIAHRDLAKRVSEVRPSKLEDIVLCGPASGEPFPELKGIRTHEESVLWSETAEVDLAIREPWDLGVVIYTSGTTGPSKGVKCSYLHNHQSMHSAYAHLTDRDRFLVNTPLFHIAGIGGVATALMTGGSFAVVRDFNTADFWKVVRRYECTAAVLVGVMTTFLLKAPPSPEEQNNTLASVVMVPLGSDAGEFHTRFDCDVYTVFNMTEISSPMVAGPNPSPAGTCGKLRPGMYARLVDENDIDVPEGTVGELILRADLPWSMNSGYLNNPEATSKAWQNGWFHTGDAFKRDADGNYFFCDRMKDAIRRRGENISSFEVENVVMNHPAVREVAAVGVPSPLGEEDVLIACAVVEGKQIDPEELLTFLVPLLPHFMVPRYVRLVDGLPRTPTAKIQKHILRTEGVTKDTYDREKAGFVVKREKIT